MARTKDFDEQEVLARAIEIFWLKGYNNTSMQDLVDHLGISRSSMYDTYKDKRTLFLKALEAYRELGKARIRHIIEHTGSAKETIKKLLELVTKDLLHDKQQKGCFMVNAEVEVAAHDADVSDLVCSNDREMEEAFFQVVLKGQETGELKNVDDARALARFIFNSVKGMRVTAKSTRDKQIFKDIIALTISVLQ